MPNISSKLPKRPFALLEMLLVIALIALFSGLLAIKIPQALKKERFEAAVEEVISKISFATELMLDYRVDVTLVFLQKQEGLFYAFELNQPLPSRIRAKLEKKPIIKGIENIAFDEKTTKICLLFDGSLGTISRGTLHLGGCGENRASLVLRGFPSKIIRGNDDHFKKSSAIYPEEILSAL